VIYPHSPPSKRDLVFNEQVKGMNSLTTPWPSAAEDFSGAA